MSRTERIGWIEWVRALGACAVVLLHVFVSTSLSMEIDDVRAGCYAVLGITLCRWAVPGFFMISGYLLLDPSRTYGWPQAKRHAMRMVGVIACFGFAFSLLEEVWNCARAGSSISSWVLVAAVRDVLTASSWDHLWYVYAIMVAYLLVVPVRMLRKRWGEGPLWVLTAVLFALVLVVPTLSSFSVFLANGEPPMPPTGLGALAPNVAIGFTCMCIGDRLRSMRMRLAFIVCGLVSLAIMVTTSLWGIVRGWGDLGFVFLQGSCFACMYAAFVLMAIRILVGESSTVDANSLVARLAHDSFGIYVLHPLFVHAVLLLIDPSWVTPILFEALCFCLVLAASIATTHLMRRLPVVGSLL